MTQLNQELIDFLQGERMVSLVTIDPEAQRPIIATVSWLVAQQDGKTIKIAVGHNASSVNNIEQNPQVVLNVIAPDTSYEISGKAEVSEVKKGTMKFRVITVSVETVNENMFYGGKVESLPTYSKTYDEELAKKLDSEIYAELK